MTAFDAFLNALNNGDNVDGVLGDERTFLLVQSYECGFVRFVSNKAATYSARLNSSQPEQFHTTTNVRHGVFDSNFWKSFVQARLAVPAGDQGSLTLFGDTPTRHRLFAEHLSPEYRVQTSGRGRTVDEWKMRPERSDNHWLGGLVGCAVGPSIQWTSLLGETASGGRAVRTFVLPGRR